MEDWKILLKYEGLQKTVNPVTQNVTGVSIDTRTLVEGNIFFALRTEKSDGHFFIAEAIRKGASVIIAEDDHRIPADLDENTSVWIVDNTLKALQKMAGIHRRQFDIPVIAITGSNGKTTTKEMLGYILSEKYNVIKNRGNLNNHLGVPLTLFEIDQKTEVAIIEMGTNHPGELALLAKIADPTMAIVTGIGNAHIGNFSSVDALVIEKTALFSYVENKSGEIILNRFDQHLKDRRYKTVVKTIGPERSEDFFSDKVIIDPEINGIKFTLNDDQSIEIPIPGYHNRSNAMLAIAAAAVLGLSAIESGKRLKSFTASDKRMEVRQLNSYTIINDCYNASPESMYEAIRYAQELALSQERPLVFALGDMLELGEKSRDFHEQIKVYIDSSQIDSIWLAGKDMAFLARAIENNRFPGGIHYAIEADSWIGDFLNKLPKNAIILIKASRGMQMEKVVTAILSEKG